MQPTEAFSVPRRALDVEDYIDILRRHKGWIFGPFHLTLVASVVGVYLWPDSYVSTASIKITPQQISERLIQNVSNQDIVERIDALQSQVLSRSRANQSYPKHEPLSGSEETWPKWPREDVLELMRKSIKTGVAWNRYCNGYRALGRSLPNQLYISGTGSGDTKVVQALVTRFTD